MSLSVLAESMLLAGRQGAAVSVQRPPLWRYIWDMVKKAKSLHRWRISLIKGTPAKYLGYVEAADEKSALDEAAKEFRISNTLRNQPDRAAGEVTDEAGRDPAAGRDRGRPSSTARSRRRARSWRGCRSSPGPIRRSRGRSR